MSNAPPQDIVPAQPESYKYWAFISYSHADEEWAQWLHKSLETYKVPKKLVGRQMTLGSVPRRVFPVFRDRDELPGASDLGGNIKQALKQSRYIVVICSPKAAISKWVNEEIKGFKSLDRENRVLCLIVDGEPNAKPDSGQLECFPPAVRFHVGLDGKLTEDPTEPIAADARKGKDGRANAKLKLLSGILNVGYDELKQREKQRQLNRKLRIAAGIVSFLLLTMIVYVFAADANINVPGGERVRTFLDRHQASLLRPVRTDAEVRQAAAKERRVLLDALKGGRIKDGLLTNNLSTPEKGGDVWSHSQALFSIFKAPDASRQELREMLPSLELTFKTGVAPEVKGVKYGWSSETLIDEKQNWVKANSESVEAVPTLWTVGAVTVALGRPGLIEEAERPRFEAYLKYAQEATRVYRPLETGGWNLFAYQKDPAFDDPYSTTLALLVLLETHNANLPWEGSTERRDAMLQASAQWLVNNFNEKSNPPGWKGTADEVNEIFDGLTIEIYSLLLRAEAETGFKIPQKILDQIPRHLSLTNARDLKFPTAKGEHIAFVSDPNTGREYRMNESVGFLWHPWAIDCAVRWLKHAEKYGATSEDIVRVRRALGHMVVDMGDEATKKAVSEWTFVAAETLYGMSAVPLP
ncbi:MAG: eukaryotic-like serine/threonine-protein kinase [Blastocatellia bacterium]|jgi:hypothetical protein|nr:eukaryotic-like serine/threonine-protein kinase [Blastocatellia bacterium]